MASLYLKFCHSIIIHLRILDYNNQRVDIPFKDQGLEKKPVIIEDDVWIGTNVVIIGKAKIGKGSVISAGSVVSGDIKANSVVVGNPGRVVKRR